MRLSSMLVSALVAVTLVAPTTAHAECRCVAVAGDVFASVQAEVMRADGLYARGDFGGALAIYAKAYATSRDAALLYAQGMAQWSLGMTAEAKASFQAYLAAGGTLAYRDRAEAALAGLGVSATAAVSGAVRGAGGLVGGLAGDVRGGVEGGVGAGAGVVGTGVGVTGGVVGGVNGELQQKTKIGKKAGIVLGVIAIAAIGAVGIHSIAAGVSDDISLDPKFDLGLGIAGVSVGISAIYVAGLTATTAAAAPALCASLPTKTPIVAPYATNGGGGLAAAMTF